MPREEVNTMTNIKKFFRLLEEYNIDYRDESGKIKEHWLLPDSMKKYKKGEVVKKLLLTLGVEEVRHSNYRTYSGRTCPENCVCPDCYRITLYTKKESVNKLSSEDIQDLVDDINYERYLEIGKKRYLEEYNSRQPDFLKITEKELNVAISYLKRGVKNGISK